MAEGGGEFGYKDPDLNNQIDHDDDDDDENEIKRTQPFEPGEASTPYQPGAPYHGGEQTEMHTILHKQSGRQPFIKESFPSFFVVRLVRATSVGRISEFVDMRTHSA